jgi:hypothetical protein
VKNFLHIKHHLKILQESETKQENIFLFQKHRAKKQKQKKEYIAVLLKKITIKSGFFLRIFAPQDFNNGIRIISNVCSSKS